MRWSDAEREQTTKQGRYQELGLGLLMVMVKWDEPPFVNENPMVLRACLGRHILIANAM